MEEEKKATDSNSDQVSQGQQWFDRIFFWLIASIVISGLFYNAWGLIELFANP